MKINNFTETTATDKVQMGDSLTGTSTSTSYTINSKPQAERGWECPRCGRINAPWKSQCDCAGNNYWYPTWGYNWDYSEPWWKRIYCDSDTFRVHPETTTWKAPSSTCRTNGTTAQANPNDKVTAWSSSATSVNSPWNQFSTLTSQLDKLQYEINQIKENG